MRLGPILRKWRLANDFTVRDVAARIGIAPSTLVHIEMGKMPPSSQTIIALWNFVIAQEESNAGDGKKSGNEVDAGEGE